MKPPQLGLRMHNSTSISMDTYLNTVVPPVSTQGQTDLVCFDLSNVFGIVTHSLPFRDLTNLGLVSVSVGFITA